MADGSDIADFTKKYASNRWCKLDLDFSPGTLVRTLFDLGRLYERQQCELGESGKIQTTKVSEL